MARYVRSIFLSSFSVIPNVCASTTILKIADIFAHTPSQTPAPQSSNLAVGVAVLRELSHGTVILEMGPLCLLHRRERERARGVLDLLGKRLRSGCP